MIKSSVARLIMIAVIAVMAAGPAYCQGDEALETISGTVISVDPQNAQIVIKSIETLTFSVSADAQIVDKDGLDIELSDIKPGTYAMVDYYDDSEGRHIIKNIEIEYNS